MAPKRKDKTGYYSGDGKQYWHITASGYYYLIDAEDKHIIDAHSFCRKSDGSLQRNTTKGTVMLHRVIMGNPPTTLVVDHINGVTWDNRKANLQVCTQGDNVRKARKKKNNTSGYPGVNWHKRRNKWSASICRNYMRVYLGNFDTKEEAIKARKRAEKTLFGR